MTREGVIVTGHIPAPPAEVWALAGDFCGTWHPAIAKMRAERGPANAEIRSFTVHGDPAGFREQLIYRSLSDRELAYLALEGIEGAARYVGRIALGAAGGGTDVTWTAEITAEITAPAARAAQIADGTKPIFEAGIAGLRAALGTRAPHTIPTKNSRDASPLDTIMVPGSPPLALTVTPARPGPLVLFLHGIGGARGNWDAQLRAVAPFARAAALDLRGYGSSALGADQSTIADHCADINRVMQSLGTEKLILVGLSFGAWIATSFALHTPGVLSGLVLSGGCTGMSEASPAERQAFRSARETPLNRGQSPADFAPEVVKILAGPQITDQTRAALVASMSAIPAATYRDALICFTSPPERFDFARLTMPVLMMTGAHDRLASPMEIRGVARRIVDAAPRPDVQFEEIAGAGHLCNLEQPGAYNRHLTAFVQRLLV